MSTLLEEAVALLRETLAMSKSETDYDGKTTVDEAAVETFLERYDRLVAGSCIPVTPGDKLRTAADLLLVSPEMEAPEQRRRLSESITVAAKATDELRSIRKRCGGDPEEPEAEPEAPLLFP